MLNFLCQTHLKPEAGLCHHRLTHIYQTLRFWHEVRLTRKHWRRRNTEGESWQKTPQTAVRFFSFKGCLRSGTTSTWTDRKRWMMITWKCSFTCNTLAARPQRSNCGPAWEILRRVISNTMLCTVWGKTELNKLFKTEETEQYVLYVSHQW